LVVYVILSVMHGHTDIKFITKLKPKSSNL